MYRKQLHIVLSVAGAVSLGLAGQAAALPLSAYDGTTLDVYISGASAQDQGLEGMMRRLCSTGTLDIYRASNQRMMFCTMTSAVVPAFGAGKKVMVHKSSVGGSGNGVNPVADATALAFMNQTSTCTSPGTAEPATALLPAYTSHTCSVVATTSIAPDMGLSDVEPRLLGAGQSQLNKLAPTPVSANGLQFGVPVTKKLRDALQVVQGLISGSDEPGQMPSLTTQQVRGILAGGITDWSQLTNAAGVPLTTAPGVTAPSTTAVYLARRVSSSGTQASFNAYFLNFPCATGVTQMLVGNDSTQCGAVAGTLGTVNEGSGTGNVLACLETHNTANRWAIGMASMENVPGGTTPNYRYVKLDGQAPTLLNAIEGRYEFWMEQTMQWRGSNSTNPLTGDKLTLATKISTDLGQPAVVEALNQAFVQNAAGTTPWQGGIFALPLNGWTPATAPRTDASVLSAPTLTATRSITGSTNNCQPPIQLFDTRAN